MKTRFNGFENRAAFIWRSPSTIIRLFSNGAGSVALTVAREHIAKSLD
jgi:hypothetical protein